MPITTIYTCDRCNHSQTTPEQMWTIAVAVYHDAWKPPNLTYDAGQGKRGLWCRKCCTDVGIFPTNSKPLKIQVTEERTTLEDLLREIIQGEIEMIGAERNG